MNNQFSVAGVKPLSNEALNKVITGYWVEFKMENLTGRHNVLANVGEEDPKKLWIEIQEYVFGAYGQERVRASLECGYLFLIIDTTDYRGKGVPARPEPSGENDHLQIHYLRKRAMIKALVESEDQWNKWFCK
ncbi:hypothetical protein MGU_05168 [Metarhizium guizhouense ARSEF 977]|uniref:Uncharacterized protein n=1 Tax=Metarhizium guizhouense (strain ARSEF 977) TaxID=1276136 RepID=A0A0B4GLB7_METGA|nr:hypothetical protein MGU_05168 [Metarhizium guizhouense ARSEF 977]